MSNVHTKLGSILFTSLEKLRNEKGSIDISDIGIIFEQLSQSLNEDNNSGSASLREEIAKLSDFLTQTKNEIFDVRAINGSNTNPQEATQQVHAVIQNTEEASHKIIDSASAINELAGQLEPEIKSKISAEVTKIYEACSFQDLTSQRLRKVLNVLDWLGEWSDKMLKNFSNGKSEVEGDAKLLNGPQLPDKAPSQDDIDALFSDLK